MDLKLGHYDEDGIEVIDVQGEIDIYTAPRLRELLIDLACDEDRYRILSQRIRRGRSSVVGGRLVVR